MKVFFHSVDFDGKCSGAIVKMHYPEAELIGINYGQEFPWDSIDPQEVVFMVDFSLQPFTDMLRLREMCDLVWVDHHKSAIEERNLYGIRFEGILNREFAGCELTWSLLFGDKPPRAVNLLGRYDVWEHHNLAGSLEFQYGMRQFDADPNDQEFWQRLFRDDEFVEQIIRDGLLLLTKERKSNAMYLRAAGFDTTLDGLRVLAVNKGLANSLLFEGGYDPERHDAMLAFCWYRDKWKISLYADKPGVDVSQICKLRGGGGHKGAAGFQCLTLPFDLP